MNILIIDDNESLSLMAREKLETTGNYNIDTVHDGAEALDILRQHRYDIIILDVVLPRVSGITILEEIRSDYSKNKESFIIVTSSITHPALVENASKLGADYFITKPFKVESLVDAVEVYKQIEHLKFVPCQSGYTSGLEYSSTTKDMLHKFDEHTFTIKTQSSNIAEFCSQYLKSYEISEHFKGYDLIIKAFQYLLENDNNDNVLVTKDIYPHLAKLTNTCATSVERNIRNAIKCAKCNHGEQKLTNLTFLLKMKKTYTLEHCTI